MFPMFTVARGSKFAKFALATRGRAGEAVHKVTRVTLTSHIARAGQRGRVRARDEIITMRMSHWLGGTGNRL